MKINTKKVVVGMPPEIYAALEKLAGKNATPSQATSAG